jgi:hypothetical protein
MLAVCASAAALAPLADTIYIPSLYTVRQDLHTSPELAAATVRISQAEAVAVLFQNLQLSTRMVLPEVCLRAATF